MTQLELLERANRFYPDGHLAEYYDDQGNFVDNDKGGDGLARFIVVELTESVDLDQDDASVLDQAKRAMHRGMDDICAVLAGLDDLVNWRLEV